MLWGFPGGPVVKNPPANAGVEALIPDPTCGESHMAWDNYGHSPQLLRIPHPRAQGETWTQEKPLQWEACTPQLESSRCSPQLEKAHVQQCIWAQPKI